MKSDEIIKKSEEHLFHVYNRFPVVFDHGEGVCLYDKDGREYLDFASGIGVSAFGYNDSEYTEAVHAQVDRLLHVSNLYYTTPMADAAAKVCEATGMDRVFFTNSGAEAIEGALKTAKKYFYNKKGESGAEIIAMENSFHGRTVGALSVTGTTHYREPFYPLMDGVKFAEFNNIDSVKNALSDRTAAIILEPVQGEGGLRPAEKDFIEEIYSICKEKDILFIADEIQCGMGRTGTMYAYEQYNIKPDIVTTAKALGGGLPVGAFAVNEKVAKSSLVPGDHGTTYGGNPLVLAGVMASIGIIQKRDLPGHVRELAPYLEKTLQSIVDEFDFALERRGRGFMQGIVLSQEVSVGDIVAKCLDAGLVVLSAGGNVLRLLPPLVIEKEHIDRMQELLVENVLKKM